MIVYVPRDASDTLATQFGDAPDYDRAWILSDTLHRTTGVASGTATFTFNKNFGVTGMMTEFDAATAASYNKNPIRVRFLSNANRSGGMQGNATVWYTDP
jgi:hypothetical protein